MTVRAAQKEDKEIFRRHALISIRYEVRNLISASTGTGLPVKNLIMVLKISTGWFGQILIPRLSHQYNH